jgi:hypothetical protein
MEGRPCYNWPPCFVAFNVLTTMAPNLALSKHDLIQSMISSKLQDDKALKDDDIAKTAINYVTEAVTVLRQIR